MTLPTIGWIGTGAMGLPMCRNLLRAGYPLHVCDALPARVGPLVDAGAIAQPSPRAIAESTDVIVSIVLNDQSLQNIVGADHGLLSAAAARARIFMDMSTVSPSGSADIASALAGTGLRYLRAPVSGTVHLAESAQLGTYVSGDRGTFEEILPILRALTVRQTWVGDAEEARVVKLVINLIVYLNTAAIGEGLLLGERSGLDRGLMIDAINNSVVGSIHYRGKAEKLRQKDYSVVAPISLVAKDMALMLDVARDTGATLPMAALVSQYLTLMQRKGQAGDDLAALADVLQRTVGA